MRAESLFGKPVAEFVTARAKSMADNNRAHPNLRIFRLGNDEASGIYVEAKRKACEEAGFGCSVMHLPKKVKEEELLSYIHEANRPDNEITGIIVQLPLPPDWGLNLDRIVNAIDPRKDVDCLTNHNLGRVAQGHYNVLPCTVQAVLTLIDEYEIGIAGEDVAIVGRSRLVGLPLACVMMSPGLFGDATVHVVHQHTRDLPAVLKQCSVVVSAVGKEGFAIKGDMVRKGSYLIDVGIRRDGDKVVGDFDESVWEVAESVTPVPGGVGPVTVACVLRNMAQLAVK